VRSKRDGHRTDSTSIEGRLHDAKWRQEQRESTRRRNRSVPASVDDRTALHSYDREDTRRAAHVCPDLDVRYLEALFDA
jgi:hypothetical protein